MPVVSLEAVVGGGRKVGGVTHFLETFTFLTPETGLKDGLIFFFLIG